MKKSHDTIPRRSKPSQIIGRLLREARTQAGLTQLQVADRMGCFRPRISYLENGHIIPNLDTVHYFAKACGKDFIMILATESDKNIINRLNR
jgi:transcriptional regulator with XRE-family HTH domain